MFYYLLSRKTLQDSSNKIATLEKIKNLPVGTVGLLVKLQLLFSIAIWMELRTATLTDGSVEPEHCLVRVE